MKLFKTIAATACALALATAAHAATYSDSSANYPDGWSSGSNGGEGFGPWRISSTSGSGYAGGGIWETAKAEVTGDVVDANGNAFGIVGKGDGSSFTATRDFRASLAVGDSFEFDMAVNWDCGSDNNSKKGIALLLGDADAIVINHDAYPGPISVNGFWDNASLTNYGTGTMHWTILAKDETTVTVTGTARDGVSEPYSTDIELASSALTGFRLQSALQQNGEEGDTDEERLAKADKRQSYFNNFTLNIAAELPDLTDLEFTDGKYAVTSNNQELSYTLKRSSSDGELTVNVKSSFEAFIPSTTATFADGESETTFTVTATLQPKAENKADLTVSAVGCNPAVYENVRGPKFDREVKDGQWEFMPNDSATFWMHWYWDGFDVDCTKVSLSCEPAGAVVLPASLEWNPVDEVGDDGVKAWLESSFTVVSSGKILFQYDGVTFDDWDVTVKTIGFELSGPTSVKTDATATFTLKATLDGSEEGCSVSVEPADGVTVDPASFDLVEAAQDGFYYRNIEVTFATAGDYTISVKSANYSASIDVSVSEPADFSDYVAYDDASLYDGNFDFASTGAGQEGFGAWQVVRSGAEYGNVDVGGADAGMPSILSDDGKALFLYGNGGEDPAYAVVRPFANTLQPGQKASVEFVASEAGGSRVVRFVRIEEGGIYNRFEIWNNSGNIGINVDGVETALDWSSGLRRVEASIELAADGSSYTLELLGHNPDSDLLIDDIYQHVVNSDVGYWGGGIQGIYFEGTSTEGDLVFNRLAIEQVEEPVEPVVKRNIGIMGTWNPDATGDYDFYVGPSEASDEAIGTVALTVTPDDGRITISPASVEVPGDNVAAFTVTVNSLPADGEQAVRYTIKATPVNELVNPATFDVTPAQPYVYLSSVTNQLTTDDGPIGLVLHASPARYGEYRITTDDGNVFSIPENYQTVTLSEEQPEATFFVDIVGPSGENGASIYATLGEGEAWCDYRFWVSEGSDDPYADILLITAIDRAESDVVLTVEGTPTTAYGATEVVNKEWSWKRLDDATIAGNKVTVPMADRFMVIKVEK